MPLHSVSVSPGFAVRLRLMCVSLHSASGCDASILTEAEMYLHSESDYDATEFWLKLWWLCILTQAVMHLQSDSACYVSAFSVRLWCIFVLSHAVIPLQSDSDHDIPANFLRLWHSAFDSDWDVSAIRIILWCTCILTQAVMSLNFDSSCDNITAFWLSLRCVCTVTRAVMYRICVLTSDSVYHAFAFRLRQWCLGNSRRYDSPINSSGLSSNIMQQMSS